MEVTGFGGRGEYTAGHIQLWLKVGPIASLARFHESILPCTFGKALVTQTSTSPVHLQPMCEGKTEWQDDTHSGKPFAIRAGRGPLGGNHVL